jgi:hypothetical protein
MRFKISKKGRVYRVMVYQIATRPTIHYRLTEIGALKALRRHGALQFIRVGNGCREGYLD